MVWREPVMAGAIFTADCGTDGTARMAGAERIAGPAIEGVIDCEPDEPLRRLGAPRGIIGGWAARG